MPDMKRPGDAGQLMEILQSVLVFGIVDVTPVAIPLVFIAVVFVIAVLRFGGCKCSIRARQGRDAVFRRNLSDPRSRGAIV
jgi:hypothetical protein